MKSEEAKKRYGVGIDTGGTFTDAVLLDLDSRNILKTVKCPTTHYNVGVGVLEALSSLLVDVERKVIEIVAFSTTLATNTVAEGQGAKVGLLLIGPVRKAVDLPVVSTQYLSGGHNTLGVEYEPLDIERVVEAVEEFKDSVDAYAIAASMSLTNNSHELVTERAIKMLDPKPVFCSHQCSEKTGIMDRAATTVFNARLMPVLMNFVSSLQKLSKEMSIAADLKIIRGDASAVDMEHTVTRAGQTVASGPAATAFFGAKSVMKEKALIVDIGGTTTDISLVQNGRPLISSDGSMIDRWSTHIDAVRTHTVGIGGDSLVKTGSGGQLKIGPGRVLPLAMSAGVADPQSWMGADNSGRYFVSPGKDSKNSEPEDPILEFLRDKGAAFSELKQHTGMSEFSLDRRIEDLVFRRKVIEIGFTPTDALHVLKLLDIGDRASATSGSVALAKLRDQSPEAFCKQIIAQTQKKIYEAIVSFLFAIETGAETTHFPLLDKELSLFSVSFKLDIPIVGIGAAADKLLPEVAKQLQTQFILPPHYEVGNAVGAIMIASDGAKSEKK